MFVIKANAGTDAAFWRLQLDLPLPLSDVYAWGLDREAVLASSTSFSLIKCIYSAACSRLAALSHFKPPLQHQAHLPNRHKHMICFSHHEQRPFADWHSIDTNDRLRSKNLKASICLFSLKLIRQKVYCHWKSDKTFLEHWSVNMWQLQNSW